MKKFNKVLVVSLVGVAIVLGSIGVALAGNGFMRGEGRTPPSNAQGAPMGKLMDIDLLQELPAFLGMTEDEIRTELDNGKTLVQIAESKGKTEEELINFIVSKKEEALKSLLEEGKITQEQYDRAIENIDDRVKEMVESLRGERPGKGFERGFGRQFKQNNCPNT